MYHRDDEGNRVKSPSYTGENQLTWPNTETLLNGNINISCGDIEVSTKVSAERVKVSISLGAREKGCLPSRSLLIFMTSLMGHMTWSDICTSHFEKRKQNLKRKLSKFLIP